MEAGIHKNTEMKKVFAELVLCVHFIPVGRQTTANGVLDFNSTKKNYALCGKKVRGVKRRLFLKMRGVWLLLSR